MSINITIIVEGGLVQTVYADGQATVEVLDIDNSGYAETDEDVREMEKTERRVQECITDPKRTSIY